MRKTVGILLATIFLAGSMCSCGKEKGPEIFRGVRWEMTKEEVSKIELENGAEQVKETDTDIFFDVTIGDCKDVRIHYTFDSEGGTLSEFMIGSVKNGVELLGVMGPMLVDLYGEGEYASQTVSGAIYSMANWESENVKIECVMLTSLATDEAYFTFSQIK